MSISSLNFSTILATPFLEGPLSWQHPEQNLDAYPELSQQREFILSQVQEEESRFLVTLDQGTEILNHELKKMKKTHSSILSGEFVFKLYDTYGFPLDLTQLMAAEQNIKIDEREFEAHMQKARETAKASWKGKTISSDEQHMIKWAQDIQKESGETQFSGYETQRDEGKVLSLSNGSKVVESLKAGETGFLILDKTCFYAESGGQRGDVGFITTSRCEIEILDCTKQGNIHIHSIKVLDGDLHVGESSSLKVLESHRRQMANNHSATHLLHSALRKILGDHVSQAGSLVEATRLRFDFTHSKPLSAEEIHEIEDLVNEEISRGVDTDTQVMSPEEAKKAGALALFGEKYGEKVRVVRMGDFSMELCGGTHVKNSAMIRLFKIVSEAGVSSGVRRIEALTGEAAIQWTLRLAEESLSLRGHIGLNEAWTQYLDQPQYSLRDWADSQKNQIKELKRQLKVAQGDQVDIESLVANAVEISLDVEGAKDKKIGKLVCAELPVEDRQLLSELNDKIKNKIQKGIVVTLGDGEGTYPLIVSVTKDFSKEWAAGSILKTVTSILGGKGGGRPDFAQGAANSKGLQEKALPELLKNLGN